MVAGVHGVIGAHAQKRVALVHSTAVAPATNQVQHTEESSVLDKTKRFETATPTDAQVDFDLQKKQTGLVTIYRLSLSRELINI